MSTNTSNERHVLVTGGAIRVGRAIAMALAKAGHHVAIHCGTSTEAAEQTAAEIRSLGGRSDWFSADLGDPKETKQIIARARKALDAPIDFLVNSAALYLDGNLAETSLDDWELQHAVNLRAPFLITQAFAAQPELTRELDPVLLNILDARSNRAGDDHFAYRVTKAGLEAMTKNLALDLAPTIRVNGLALGAIMPPPGKGQDHLDRIAKNRVPMKQSGTPEMIGGAAVYLASQPFITGTVIDIDGGEFL